MEMQPPIKVLIVQKQCLVAEVLSRALSAMPDLVSVGRAGSVSGALSAMHEHRPDVVLMDPHLPDGTGASATVRIKNARPDIHVIMISGQSTSAALASALDAGCSGFVEKVDSLGGLVDTIRGVVVGEVRVPEALLSRRSPGRPNCELSRREREVLTLLADGRSNAQIASALFVSVYTARNHTRHILTKLDACSRLEAVANAVRSGLVVN